MERVNMSIETLEQTELTEQDREHLKQSSALWKQMRSGKHLDDWLSLLPDLQNGRRLAMRYAGVNKPEGRGYAEGFSGFLARWFPDLDKTSISCLLWLGEEPRRLEMLAELRATMTVSQRVKLGSPITARQKVEARLKVSDDPSPQKKRMSPTARLEELLREKDEENAELKRQVIAGDGGSLFDWNRDDVASIARILYENGTPSKAVKLADAIMAHHKKMEEQKKALKNRKPAG
jgi:hypothetical protein